MASRMLFAGTFSRRMLHTQLTVWDLQRNLGLLAIYRGMLAGHQSHRARAGIFFGRDVRQRSLLQTGDRSRG